MSSDIKNLPRKSEDGKAASEQIAQFMTTEHFTLQTGRAATIAEANGRISLFIGAVSSAVVAIAFIGQMSKMDDVFYIFALVLFGSLIFLGFVTFHRVLQTALEDWIYTHKIDRIRHFYAENAPQYKGFFNDSLYENSFSPMNGIIPKGGNWQFFLTASGMVSGINSILTGVFVGLIFKYIFAAKINLCIAAGVVFFLAGIYFHYRRQIKAFSVVGENIRKLLPFAADNNQI